MMEEKANGRNTQTNAIEKNTGGSSVFWAWKEFDNQQTFGFYTLEK